jgi:hypothetical protein
MWFLWEFLLVFRLTLLLSIIHLRWQALLKERAQIGPRTTSHARVCVLELMHATSEHWFEFAV